MAISLPEYPSLIWPSVLKSAGFRSQGVVPTASSNIFILPGRSGRLICTLRWNRLRIAASSCQGMLVAPSMRTPLESRPTPSIWTRSSVFILREASDSPSPLGPQRASTSSMKMIEGLFSRAMLKSCFTSLDRACEICFITTMLRTMISPFTLSHPFRNQITTAHTEECAICLRSNSFRQVRFTSPRWSVK